jgi:hypothetical protein
MPGNPQPFYFVRALPVEQACGGYCIIIFQRNDDFTGFVEIAIPVLSVKPYLFILFYL